MPTGGGARRLRIAILGTRGVPARYSGFETCAEELGARLAARGHAVTVYCRAHHSRLRGRSYRGLRRVTLPGIATKHLDTLSHTFMQAAHALLRRPRPDLVYLCGVGNAPVAALLRAGGLPVVFNVDGSDWRRAKWGRVASAYLRLSERLAVAVANVPIADARAVQAHYRATYGIDPPYIAYGATRAQPPPGPTLARFELTPRRYVLFVGRLVPENGAHEVIEAFAALPARDRDGLRLVIVGDAPYSEEYIRGLHAQADRLLPAGAVTFAGYLFGEGYRELQANCLAFVLAAGVGGTHPVLIEAMASRALVIAKNTPPTLEVVGAGQDGGGEAAITYRHDLGAAALTHALAAMLALPEAEREALRDRALARVTACYDWDRVADRYEALFLDVARPPANRAR